MGASKRWVGSDPPGLLGVSDIPRGYDNGRPAGVQVGDTPAAKWSYFRRLTTGLPNLWSSTPMYALRVRPRHTAHRSGLPSRLMSAPARVDTSFASKPWREYRYRAPVGAPAATPLAASPTHRSSRPVRLSRANSAGFPAATAAVMVRPDQPALTS